MIVEDEVLIATDLKQELEGLGYEVCANLTSAEEALYAIEETRPDLIIMDIILHGQMTGVDAAKIIRKKWGIPIVFLSASANSELLRQANLAYPFGYLLKPFQTRDLKIVVEMALYVNQVDAERRRAEEIIRLSEEKYRFLTENITDVLWQIDTNLCFTYVSSAVEGQLGYKAEEVVGKSIFEFMTSRSIPLVMERARPRIELAQKGTRLDKYSFEYEQVRKNGEIIWVEVLTNALYSPEGQLIGWQGVTRDITTRKLAEEALRQNETKMRMLLDEASDPFFSFYPDGRYRYVNQAFAQGVGRKAEEIIGKTLWDVFPQEEADKRFAALKETFATGEIKVIEVRVPRPDGDNYYITTIKPVKDVSDQVVSVICSSKNITDRKRVEERLRQSEELFRLAFHTSPEASGITRSRDGVYIDVNDGFTAITGYSRDELIGKTPEEINIWADLQDRDRLVVELRANRKVTNFETTFRLKDGRHVPALISAAVFTLDGEQHTYFTTKAIEEQKRAEAEKTKLQAQLIQAQKMESIGTLAGGVAHDFNNLLQAINGYTQLLILGKSQRDAEYRKLQAIDQACQRAAQLIRQLLLFSRKVTPEHRPIDVNQELEHARRILERTIPKMIEIELHLGPDLWPVNADPVQIEQMFLNLGGNAADAMPDSGKLVFETQNITLSEAFALTHRGAVPGNYVLITVSDTGCGMDKETVEHIFEPFYTTKDIGKGTGLGLASVYGIVKSHGGYISCYSEPGQGTTFKIFLPSAEQAKVDVEKPAPVELPQGGNETILLVDDEAPIRDLAEELLQHFGYTILTASSGEEALQLYAANNNKIDLVILDLGMPGMGGHKCLQEMLKAVPSTKVLIISGYSVNGQVKKTLELGAAGFIGKPYELQALVTKVRAVLDGEK